MGPGQDPGGDPGGETSEAPRILSFQRSENQLFLGT